MRAQGSGVAVDALVSLCHAPGARAECSLAAYVGGLATALHGTA